MKKLILVLTALLLNCNGFKKDIAPKDLTSPPPEAIKRRAEIYRTDGKRSLDKYGLVLMGGSVGDSALFSCLGYVGGLTTFDVSLLFSKEGKPVRHPDMTPKYGKTPVSKDMVSGILWCLFKLGHEDKPQALKLIEKMIAYGRAHSKAGNWVFCDEDDKKEYKISTKAFLGRCVMTPSIMKDTHRLATWLGRPCDRGCRISMATGVNLPTKATGFRRHLSILTTTRNGLIEGKMNSLSFNQLKKAVKAEPNNGIYQAAYHRFNGGRHASTWKAMGNSELFPESHASSSLNYCTEYLWQRDEVRKEGIIVRNGCASWADPQTKAAIEECELKNLFKKPIRDGETITRLVYNRDWLPCSKNHPKPMAEWLLAWAIATGEI